ncbi:uncharacterized protein [Onthophagus taurus]|uniref:uncharacterized protein isoform X3 n=1 Tax=Onthophagus taurus TaxID=166361 RepID=UPI0039BEB0E3
MSKCSLQLYVNENFTSQPSIESSDDLLKNLTSSDCKKRTICNYRDVLENYKEPLHKNCTSKTLNSVDSQKNHPVLRNYLLRHSGSVKAYHKIIKQQEEILNLCREKLAKKFSKSFLSGVKDEDIVRALKIIQDTEEPTSDKIICKILRGIVSDVSKNTSEQNEETISIDQVLKSQYSSISSSSSRRKYSFVFNKLKTLFKKSSRNHSISLSNNYNKQPNRFVYHQNCLFNPIETQFLYPYNNVEEIRNYNNYKPPFYGNFPPPGMGSNPTCACHKNLVKLQNEFEKQQSEIRLINQNLQQCLCLLHDIGDKPQEIKNAPFDSFFANTNFQAYQFGTTENLYGHGHRSHSHIHHKKKPEPKKRGWKKLSGCCGNKSDAATCDEDDLSIQSLRRRRHKKGCCQSKHHHVCSLECGHWKILAHQDMISVAAQTDYLPEFYVTDSIFDEPDDGIAATSVHSTISKGQCQKPCAEKFKPKQCQCTECKSARKKLGIISETSPTESALSVTTGSEKKHKKGLWGKLKGNKKKKRIKGNKLKKTKSTANKTDDKKKRRCCLVRICKMYICRG